jgi:hypothetical protein
MSEPVKIIVTAETAQAAAALQQFVQQASSGLQSLTPAAAGVNAGLSELRHGSMVLHEGFRTLSTSVLLLGGTQFPQLSMGIMGVTQGMRGLRSVALLTGAGLSSMLLPILGIGAAIGGGFLLWEEFGNHMKSAEDKAKILSATLEKLPAILQQIAAAQSGGLIGSAQAAKWQGMLSGAIPLYSYPAPGNAVDKEGNAGPGLNVSEQASFHNPRATRGSGTVYGTPSSLAEIKAYVAQLMLLAGLDKTRSDAAQRLKELHDQDAADSLAGVQKEIALENDRYVKELAEIKTLHATETAAGGVDNSGAAQSALDRHNATLAQIGKKQQEEAARQQAESESKIRELFAQQTAEELKRLETQISINELQEGDRRGQNYATEFKQRVMLAQQLLFSGEITEQQYTDLVNEATQKKLEAIEKVKQAALEAVVAQQQIQRADLMEQQTEIKTDPTLTESQYTAALEINLQKQLAIAGSLSEQLRITRELVELQNKNPVSFDSNLTKQFTDLQKRVGNLGKDAASVVMSPFEGMQAGFDTAITQMMEKGGSFKQFMGTVGLAIEKSFIASVANMVADWITSCALRLLKEAATQVGLTTLFTTGTATRTAIHTAGEAAQTGSTAAQSGMRQIINGIETEAHNLGVMLRTLFHISGESTATTATIAGATTRISAHAATAAAGAAESQASEPYVGPVLAIAAMAAILVAVLALSGAFAEGGRPPSGRLALVGERGPELWVPDSAGTIVPAHQTAAMLADMGGSSSGGGSGGGGGGGGSVNKNNVSIYPFTDMRQMADHLEKNDDHEKWIVDVMRRNIHKFR